MRYDTGRLQQKLARAATSSPRSIQPAGPTMPKHARDFVKKKQKVGKKKLAPTNSTSTAFKARSVVLTDQGLDKDKGEPLSHRKLTSGELLAQLNHYNSDVRHDALKGLTELLTRFPEVLPPIAPTVLQRALLLSEDEYPRVRRASRGLLRTVLTQLEAAGALGPHEQAVCLRLQSALTHPHRPVRVDALELLQLLIELRPGAVVPPPVQLVPSLVEMLDSAAPTGDRAAASSLDDAASTVRALRAVLFMQRLAAGGATEEVDGGAAVGAGTEMPAEESGRTRGWSTSQGGADAGDGAAATGTDHQDEDDAMDDDELEQGSQDEEAEEAEEAVEARLDDDEDEEELGQDLVEGEDGSPTKATGGASGRGAAPAAIGQSFYGFGRWRGAPQLPPPSQPLAANASSAPAAAERASGAALIAQLLPLPSLLVRWWLESGVTAATSADVLLSVRERATAAGRRTGGRSTSSIAAVDCAAAVVAACREVLLCEASPARPLQGPDADADGLRGFDDEDSGGGGGMIHAPLTRALSAPLLKHIAPHVPLGGDGGGGASIEAAKRRALDAALCELCCLQLAALPSTSHGSAAELEATRSNLAAELEATHRSLCARLSAYLCREFAPGGADDSAATPSHQHSTQLLRACRALLGCSWVAPGVKSQLQHALVELWEGSAMKAPCRLPLLALLTDALVAGRRSGGGGGGGSAASGGAARNDKGDGSPAESNGAMAVELPAALAARVLKSLPKLLWLARDQRPALSHAMLQTLLAVGRTTDTIPPLQLALVPFFAATPRGALATAPPLLGPFADLPATTRQAAAHVLARLPRLEAPLVNALATVGCHVPSLVPQLLSVIEMAHARGALDAGAATSFGVTLALEAATPPMLAAASAAAHAQPPTAAVPTPGGHAAEAALEGARLAAWGPCLALLRRLCHGEHGAAALAGVRALAASLEEEEGGREPDQVRRRKTMDVLSMELMRHE